MTERINYQLSESQSCEDKTGGVMVGELDLDEVELMYEKLEKPNWAPWLEASMTTITNRSIVFPAGQIAAKDRAGEIVASLSLNQISWSGKSENLLTWDEIAGEPTDYGQTYNPQGNTLAGMSMNVRPDQKGKRLPGILFNQAKQLARDLKIEHLLVSARPSGFGVAKLVNDLNWDFWEYCMMTRNGSSKPVDPWLGSLWHMGMKILKEQPKAMVIEVPMEEFLGYKENYNSDKWKEVKSGSGVWECGEVGRWTVDEIKGTAVYQESNLWVEIPLWEN